MRITYLVNQYPKVSHSFIRREILALERQGFNVQRIAQRDCDEPLVDEQDIREQQKTQYIVAQGFISLFWATVKCLLVSPSRFLSALCLAFIMGRRSDRAFVLHLIYLAEACKMLPWLKSHESKHLHAHFGTNSSEIAMLASKLSGIPYSFTVHGPEEFDKPQSLKLDIKIQHAKFVVAISSFGRSQLFRWIDFNSWEKIKVVHCGLESSFYLEQSQPIPPVAKLLCVGRLCEQKGQLLLLEAAKNLHDSGVDFHLTLAGDGEMRHEIETLISRYQLQEKITITGWISSNAVRDLILDSQIFVLPSFAEGLPVVIMEAMSLRRPVISTYIAGIPELIQHGENGWLCTAGDVQDLTNKLHQALATPISVMQKMGEVAYESVIKRHNIDIETTKLAGNFRA